MSRLFDVDIYTTASARVSVEISDERLTEIAMNSNCDVDDLTVNDLVDEIIESYDPPHICAQCTGWGHDYSLELSDDWDLAASSKVEIASAITEK
jgi:excinuclease UvrABC ATPase subunit